jgi:hypothetical protein
MKMPITKCAPNKSNPADRYSPFAALLLFFCLVSKIKQIKKSVGAVLHPQLIKYINNVFWIPACAGMIT